MAKTAALTELNGAKIFVMVDATGTTSVARVPLTITKANQTGGGDSTNDPAGYLGVGTHNDADTILGPGGWTFPIGSGPVVLMAGADATSGTEGSRLVKPVRIHEGGATYMLPGGSYAVGATYQAPLKATSGGVLAPAATTNTAISVALASNFAYLTDMTIIRTDATGTIPVSTEIRLMDASGGTTMWDYIYPNATQISAAATPFPLGQIMYVHFSNPPRTSVVNGQFFITTVGAGVSWAVTMNGYYSTGV